MKPLGDHAVARLRAQLGSPGCVAARYHVDELIGRGGMGEVYRAHDERLDRTVALKVIATDTSASSVAERLRREARVLAVLEHPGIVPVYDAGALEDGRTFYVMRYVNGVRLDEHAQTGVSRGELVRIVLRIADTVAFAHQHGIIHRDLKPGNVMIGPFGEVLVLDWGVAKVRHQPDVVQSTDTTNPLSGSTLTADGVAVGTPGYMSPEQLAGAADVDQRTDVFSLGVMLREILESRTEGPSKPLNALVQQATAADPAHRYGSLPDLADDLRRWLDGERVTAYRESWLERGGRFARRHQIAILLLMGYALVRIAILIFRGV